MNCALIERNRSAVVQRAHPRERQRARFRSTSKWKFIQDIFNRRTSSQPVDSCRPSEKQNSLVRILLCLVWFSVFQFLAKIISSGLDSLFPLQQNVRDCALAVLTPENSEQWPRWLRCVTLNLPEQWWKLWWCAQMGREKCADILLIHRGACRGFRSKAHLQCSGQCYWGTRRPVLWWCIPSKDTLVAIKSLSAYSYNYVYV